MGGGPPRGVAGWLLFLCLTLTVLMPAATLTALWLGWPPEAMVAAYPGLGTALWLSTFGEALVLLFGLRTGIGLWRVEAGALPRARRFLLALAGWRVTVPLLVGGLAQLPPEATEAALVEGFKDTARSLAFVLAWWVYLKRSRRVAATYDA